MKRIEIPTDVRSALQRAFEHADAFAQKHHVAVGVAEMAFGAALLAAGVKEGTLVVGVHVLATRLPSLGAAGAGGAAAGLAALVGGVGVAAMGGAFGVPAVALMGGAAVVFGLAGYDLGAFVGSLIDPSWTEYLEPTTIALLGVALIVDGARRAIGEEQLKKLKSSVADACITLHSVTKLVVARTLPELEAIAEKLAPKDAADAAGGLAASATMAAAGAAAASAATAGSVTVLGSSTLGSAAVALGFVSTPLWPVIAGAAAAGGFGYVLWKAVRNFQEPTTVAEYSVEPISAQPDLPRLPAP